jgi:hypothetical protein
MSHLVNKFWSQKESALSLFLVLSLSNFYKDIRCLDCYLKITVTKSLANIRSS